MTKLENKILEVLPNIDKSNFTVSYKDLGIDSIDLVAIRAVVQRELGESISDSNWFEFNSLAEILTYYKSQNKDEASSELNGKATIPDLQKELVINMPQMSLGALSENWLFKELGDAHWEMICNGLGKNSNSIRNEANERLYATFVRIRISVTDCLKEHQENEKLNLESNIWRFGESMYYSNVNLKSTNKGIKGELLTTFSIRNSSDNTSLAKSQPSKGINKVEELATMPDFANEYRNLRKKNLTEITYGQFHFKIDSEFVYQTEYQINPYYDINGVNLLYFAAYPIINDYCEAKFFDEERKIGIKKWAEVSYTAFKDVFYLSNCNINEVIVYRLISVEAVDENKIKMHSVLLRKSDMTPLARILTVKDVKGTKEFKFI